MSRRLVVKLTAGVDSPERCVQGFTVAAVAVTSGVPVSLWLTGESSWFVVRDRAEELVLPHSAPVSELLTAILAAGRVTLCTQCAARRAIGPDDVLAGVRIAGASAFVEEAISDDAQVLVY